ncbi:hypothetical protein CC2G_004287 [Coprinopsis cinerea AmutBmut pab1-1]|nr:hypothetical protein CC2G_004287 [Coprinopsis cinerea AmutBmut pab1-1]
MFFRKKTIALSGSAAKADNQGGIESPKWFKSSRQAAVLAFLPFLTPVLASFPFPSRLVRILISFSFPTFYTLLPAPESQS